MSQVRRASLFLAAWFGLAATGCQSLMLGDLSGAPAKPEAAVAAAGGGEKYFVEFHPVDGRPERAEMPLQGELFVQGALEQSEALDRFRREKIQIYRKTGGSTPYSRLEVVYDRSKHRVRPESDYAIHPGDRLIIAEDTSTFFDDMLGGVGKGALTGMFRQR